MVEMYLEMIELVFIVGSIFALILGGLLVIKPEKVASMSAKGNTWYSARKVSKPLDVMHDTDHIYYKYNLPIGVIMFILSIVALILIWNRMPTADQIMAVLGSSSSSISVGIFVESLRWLLLIFVTLGLPMWLMLAFSPERLKGISKRLNRWVSTRMLLMPVERMNTGFDGFVLQHHRSFGIIFMLGAVFILYKFMA